MRQVGIVECLLEEKVAIEREDADTIASLKSSVDTLTASLEEVNTELLLRKDLNL